MYSPIESIKATKSTRLSKKKIALCITGSIAAIKCLKIARELIRHGAYVQCVMSDDAQGIIHPNSMEYATGNKVITKISGFIEHVAIAGDHDQRFDLILVCPATSNTIGKAAHGIEDTPVTNVISTALGSEIPIAFVPAMHISMYNNKILQENITKLKKTGFYFLDPKIGEKKAKLPSDDDIIDFVFYLMSNKDFRNKKILITGGPTQTNIDPVRIITNESSGKMGVALAKACYFRGAHVALIYGNGSANVSDYIDTKRVKQYDEMYEQVFLELKNGYDMVISAAAISDFIVENSNQSKLSSKVGHTIKLIPAKKIIKEIKSKYPKIFVVGFKAEYDSDRLLEKAHDALTDANMDLIVAEV